MYRSTAKTLLTRRALYAASAVAVVVAPKRDEPVPTSSHSKLSIYPQPDPEIILTRTDSLLAAHIGVAREYTTGVYRDVTSSLHGVVAKWIGVEEAVERRVKSIIAKDEPMTPGLLYVGVATLTGSVVGRRRALPIRLALPPLFFLGSLSYFLPKTSSNLSAYFSELEDTYFPSLAKQHTTFNTSTRDTFEGVWAKYASVRGAAGEGYRDARRSVEARTGLKVGDGVPQVEGTLEEVKKKAVEVVERIGGETQKLGEKVQGGIQDLMKQAEGAIKDVKTDVKQPEEPPKRLV